MLTREQMLAAIYAQSADQDAKTQQESIETYLKNNAWMEAYEDEAQYTKALPLVRQRYETGKDVLARYRMHFSGRNTTGISDPVAKAECWIVVDSGHIATAQAYRTVSFSPREEIDG